MPSLRDALEAALVENPDDLATHRAYADYLQEHGDPRGEFIQVQLALEDPERTLEERLELERRERELLHAHGREWLGALAERLLGPTAQAWVPREESWEVRFARGWLERLVLRRSRTPADIDWVELLSQTSELKLLRELVLEYDLGLSLVLCYTLSLTNLRIIQIGGLAEIEKVGELAEIENSGDSVAVMSHSSTILTTRIYPSGSLSLGQAEEESHQTLEFSDGLAQLPRLEKIRLLAAGEDYDLARLFALPNLNNLRVLQVYYSSTAYPLAVLADNPVLGNLTHLLLHPHSSSEPLIDLAAVRAVLQSPHLRSLTHLQIRCSDLGDVGCTEIVTSGILKRLKMLDLRHGEITDTGARILADCPDLQRLELLDIGRNGLTQTGIDTLRRVLGDKLRADNQQSADELAQRRYLEDSE